MPRCLFESALSRLRQIGVILCLLTQTCMYEISIRSLAPYTDRCKSLGEIGIDTLARIPHLASTIMLIALS